MKPIQQNHLAAWSLIDVTSRDEVLTAALQLPERDRLAIAGQLLETVDTDSGDWMEDQEFLDELDRRAGDLEGSIAAEDLWSRDKHPD